MHILDKTFSTEYTEVKSDRRGRRKQDRRHAKRRDDACALDTEDQVLRRAERLEELALRKKYNDDADTGSHIVNLKPPPKYYPPKTWIAAARRRDRQNPRPSFEVPKSLSTARALCDCIENGDTCLNVPDCHIRAAAKCLRALEINQRPSKICSLSKFLKRRGCCSVKSAALVSPDMLLAALPFALSDKVPDHCRKQLEILAETVKSTTSDCAQVAASRVSKRFPAEVAEELAHMRFEAKAQWICHHSWGTLQMDVDELVKAMLEEGLVASSEDGKILYYNDEKLNNLPELQQVAWACEDVSFIANNCLMTRTLHVFLGDAHLGVEVAKRLRKRNLKDLARTWWLGASAGFAQMVADVEVWTETWTKDDSEEWIVICAIHIRILRLEAFIHKSMAMADESTMLEAVINQLENIAEADIAQTYADMRIAEQGEARLASNHYKDTKLSQELDEDALDAKIKAGHVIFNASKRW